MVFVDFQGCDGDTWKEMYKMVWNKIRKMVHRHANEIPDEIQSFEQKRKIDFDADIALDRAHAVKLTLNWLTQCLVKKYIKRVWWMNMILH